MHSIFEKVEKGQIMPRSRVLGHVVRLRSVEEKGGMVLDFVLQVSLAIVEDSLEVIHLAPSKTNNLY